MDAFKIKAVGSPELEAWWLIPLIPALRRQQQVDHYGFNANLVYPSKFQADQNYMVKPCLKQKLKVVGSSQDDLLFPRWRNGCKGDVEE